MSGRAPQVKAAAVRRLAEMVEPALAELWNILTDSETDVRTRLQAIKDILDRTGHKTPDELDIFSASAVIDLDAIEHMSTAELEIHDGVRDCHWRRRGSRSTTLEPHEPGYRPDAPDATAMQRRCEPVGSFHAARCPNRTPKPARSEVSWRVRSQTSPMRQVPTLVVVMVLASAVVASQTQQPTFRGGVEVIEVDVSVVDDLGRPMTDLRVPEFTVTVDGEPRRVVEAQWVSLRPAEADERDREPEPLEVFYTSNATTTRGRLILIAVDRGSITFGGGRGVMHAAGRFLDTLGSNDRAAFVAVPQPGPLVDFTAHHERVRQAVDGMVGLNSPNRRQFNMGTSEAISLVERNSPIVVADVMERLCGQYQPAQPTPGASSRSKSML